MQTPYIANRVSIPHPVHFDLPDLILPKTSTHTTQRKKKEEKKIHVVVMRLLVDFLNFHVNFSVLVVLAKFETLNYDLIAQQSNIVKTIQVQVSYQ